MENVEQIGSYLTSTAFLGSAIVICIMIVLLVVIKKYLIKKVAYTTKAEQHQNTFIGVIFNVLQYVVVLGCAVIVLQLHGVNVTSIIAGLGIIATLIGLALQDTMKDVISGINIYNNNFYKVGDMVNYNNEYCEVKYFSARITKFISIATGNTYTVCNSTISSIEKIKDNILVKITFDFEDDRKKIDKCFNLAIERAKKEVKATKRIDYYGLVAIYDEGILYTAKVVAPKEYVFQSKNAFLIALYDETKKAGVSPSFNDEHKVLNVKKF